VNAICSAAFARNENLTKFHSKKKKQKEWCGLGDATPLLMLTGNPAMVRSPGKRWS